jgi:hypothetical protein
MNRPLDEPAQGRYDVDSCVNVRTKEESHGTASRAPVAAKGRG